MAAPALGADVHEFLMDVVHGLQKAPQKELPSKYFYDELGSALFEAITVLPEYGLTRAGQRLLERHAPAIARHFGRGAIVAELGSGSGRKTRAILRAMRSRPAYHPIDVSAAALAVCRQELNDCARVTTHQCSYLDGIREVAAERASQRIAVLFLGSTIGNFDRPCASDFLSSLRFLLAPGDRLLIGADLVKDPGVLIAAYDDPTGVTAAFNLNLLARVNRELDADFDLRAFAHQARYNEAERRVEMHLVSRANQAVRIRAGGLTIRFARGETIWTESSHKYALAELESMAAASGFREVAHWADEEWPFAESLWAAV
jgi:L-histidine Nalpha-methyltransferase